MIEQKATISDIKNFWNNESCGERYLLAEGDSFDYESDEVNRYSLEPYIKDFANFDNMRGKDVLEIGVGMGCDHLQIAKSLPKTLYGIDLTNRAIGHTSARLKRQNFVSNLAVENSEKLSFASDKFDVVYSWGVLHHSENPQKCFEEVRRVLKPSGIARIMIYNKYSLTGFYLWVRYALLTWKPNTSMEEIYARYLESPGTKAYTRTEAKMMFNSFDNVQIKVQLGFGDLLLGSAGQRHKGLMLSAGRIFLPRRILKMINKVIPLGLYLLIEAKK